MQVIQGNENTTKLANYLKRSSLQYKPLSKEAELELISKYKNDQKTLNYLLVMHNIRAVYAFAKKYSSKTRDFDGLIQDGFRGLSEAASKFDISKNIKFITYAYWYIKKYILENFDERKTKVINNSISLSLSNPNLDPSLSKSNSEVTLENCIDELIEASVQKPKTFDETISAIEDKSICDYLIDNLNNDTSLSSTEKKVFIDYFYNYEKTQDIADKYSIDKVEVSKINQRILKKFKKILKDNYKINSFSDIH